MSRYKINNLEEYFKEYKKSVREPKNSGTKLPWKLTWYQEWDKVVDFNMAEAEIKWFVDAKSLLKLYWQTPQKKGDKTVIIEPNDPVKSITYFIYWTASTCL
jgi:acetyl-CoA synthetase